MAAATALILVQLFHAAIPAETEGTSYLGLIFGSLTLAASIAGLVGIARQRAWAPGFLALTGGALAAGLVLYHALPIDSPLLASYSGEEGVGRLQWISVIGGIAIGLWSLAEGSRSRSRAS